MSIAVDFYTFSKKANSTKRPGNPSVTYNCNLIEPCSIVNPVIALVGANNQFNPSDYNYARIATFDRYYFVNDWVYDGGRWVAKCNVDVLASFKNYITNQDQYYSRCSVEWNGNIGDNFYPATTKVARESSISSPSLTNLKSAEGVYVVTIVGSQNDAGVSINETSTRTFLMSGNVYSNFCGQIFGTDLFDVIEQGILKLANYIIDIKWLGLPYQSFNFETIGEPVTAINIGLNIVRLTFPAYLIDINKNPKISFRFSFSNIPKHPKQSEYGNYVNSAPWSICELVYPPIGRIEFDNKFFSNTNSAILLLDIDVQGNESYYRFYSGTVTINDNEIFGGFFNPWVTIPITTNGASSRSLSSGIVGGLQAVSSFTVSKTLAAEKAVEALGSFFDVSNPSYSHKGSQNSYACSVFTPYIRCLFTDSVTHDRDSHGSPCCKVLKLSNLQTGIFALAQDPHYEIPCTDAELEQVYNITGGGFFYE